MSIPRASGPTQKHENGISHKKIRFYFRVGMLLMKFVCISQNLQLINDTDEVDLAVL